MDSGASKHVTGNIREFETYNQYSLNCQQTMHTADGTAQPVKGVGTVKCSPGIQLATVLHVPAFPEGETGRKIGEGIRRRGLWYLDREKNGGQESSLILAAVQGDKETMAMIHHCRMGHVFF